MQDAVNLGWKLAQVVHGTSPKSLLDTYQAERHPIGARVLKNSLAQTALLRGDDRTKVLQEKMSELLKMDEPCKHYAAMMSGLDIHYDLGPGHPLLGRRMPDLDLVTQDGPRRVFTLLHEARAVLLNLGEPGALDLASDTPVISGAPVTPVIPGAPVAAVIPMAPVPPMAPVTRAAPMGPGAPVGPNAPVTPIAPLAAWTDRVQRIDVRYEGVWELPVDWRGAGAKCRVDPARRVRRVGRRRHGPRAS